MVPTVSAAAAVPRSATRFAPPLLVAAATFAAFASGLRGEFLVWDDNLNFLENPRYQGFSLENLRWMCTTFHMGHYHPLTWFTLALDYTLWGMNPIGYHLTALLLHSANAVLLYAVIRAFLRLANQPDLRWPAVVGALFYSLHPMRVESVTWITERRDVLCGFFTLLTLLFYLRRVEEERSGRDGTRWLGLALAAFAASLLSKALSITLPAVLLLLDVLVLGRFTPGSRGRILREKIPFFLLSVADAAVMLFAMRHIEAVHSIASYNLAERAAQAAYGLCFYLVKTLWPSPLLPIYPIDPQLNPAKAKYLLSMAAVVALTALLLVWRRRRPQALAAWLSYVVLLFPVLGVAVTGMQIAADRYTYLSLIPAAILIAFGLLRLTAGRKLPLVLSAATAILVGLAALTARQCLVWKDTVSLWDHQIRYHPELYFPYASRGAGKLRAGDLEGAIADYTRSISINPYWSLAWASRGGAKATLGDHEGAVADFTSAVQIDPRYEHGYTGRALSRSKRRDFAAALADCDEALRINPKSAAALAVRGIVRFERGDLRGAIADYTRSLELDPTAPDVWKNRGLAHSQGDRQAEALADYTRSLKLRPGHVETLINRAISRSLANDPAGAMEDFNEAIRRKPDPSTFLRRATARAMSGDLDGAIVDYTEAIRLSPGSADGYARRGVARLQRGDKPGAAQDFAKALEIAPPDWVQRKQVEQFLQQARGK